MRLQSTPKPVRFRISSGGQEHSSLESLLSCFDYNELKDLKSKLIQWLERQGAKGKVIANLLGNCDGMPAFEDAIKMFYGYDCETIIKNWFETKSANLRFVDLDLIKNSQRLLTIAYENKEHLFRQIDDNQWLVAINTHNRIEDIDLLNIKNKIELEIEKEKLRKDFEKKQQEEQKRKQQEEQKRKQQEEQKRKQQEEQDRREKYEQRSEEDNRQYTVKFYMGLMGKEPNYKRIAQITGLSESLLWVIYRQNAWSSEIVLNNRGVQALKPYVSKMTIDGRYI